MNRVLARIDGWEWRTRNRIEQLAAWCALAVIAVYGYGVMLRYGWGVDQQYAAGVVVQNVSQAAVLALAEFSLLLAWRGRLRLRREQQNTQAELERLRSKNRIKAFGILAILGVCRYCQWEAPHDWTTTDGTANRRQRQLALAAHEKHCDRRPANV